MEPGFYPAMTKADYLADPCPAPSLSSSIARLLIGQSPRHAWTAHPRLNPDHSHEDRDIFDIGTVFHEVVLLGEDHAVRVDVDSWRTKDAKAQRDDIRAGGGIPLKADDYDRTMAMVAAFRAQIASASEFDFRDALATARPEVAMIWREGDIWCRARCDWLTPAPMIIDLKTTGNASPDAWGNRTVWQVGAMFQEAFYRRGHRALTGKDPEWRDLVIETRPPHAMAVFGPDPRTQQLMDAWVQRAIDLWRRCVREDRWPGYPSSTAWIVPPPWMEIREATEGGALADFAKARNRNLLDLMTEWQAPVTMGAE